MSPFILGALLGEQLWHVKFLDLYEILNLWGNLNDQEDLFITISIPRKKKKLHWDLTLNEIAFYHEIALYHY